MWTCAPGPVRKKSFVISRGKQAFAENDLFHIKAGIQKLVQPCHRPLYLDEMNPSSEDQYSKDDLLLNSRAKPRKVSSVWVDPVLLTKQSPMANALHGIRAGGSPHHHTMEPRVWRGFFWSHQRKCYEKDWPQTRASSAPRHTGAAFRKAVQILSKISSSEEQCTLVKCFL